MKKEILKRIKNLGGEIDNVKGISLQQDLQSIKFNTVLYPKPEDTPWQKKDNAEPIYGMNNFVNQNKELIKNDEVEFYKKLVDHFFQLTDEGRGQVFYKNDLFTPFKEGTADYKEWNGEWEEADFRKVIKGDHLELMFVGYSYGFPDNLFICLSDPNQENPTVYGTDHEVFFDEILIIGTLEAFFDSFMTQEELLSIVKIKLAAIEF